ncbi:unnamed protein product, partial [Iphiclides podalirius]
MCAASTAAGHFAARRAAEECERGCAGAAPAPALEPVPYLYFRAGSALPLRTRRSVCSKSAPKCTTTSFRRKI